MKIYVEVRGGMVTAAYADSKDVDLQVIDYDCLSVCADDEEDDTLEIIEKELAEKKKNLFVVW